MRLFFITYLFDMQPQFFVNPVYIPLINDTNRYLVLRGGSGCFTEDTMVYTKFGLKKISEVSVGDEVLSYNHLIDDFQYQPVLETFSKKDDVVSIEMDDGSIIECTLSHKFWDGESYVPIGDILNKNGLI